MEARTSSNLIPQNGSAIREIRKREGLTVSDLAHRVGISDPHVRNIENENRPASIEHMARIAAALNCSLSSIRRIEQVPA